MNASASPFRDNWRISYQVSLLLGLVLLPVAGLVSSGFSYPLFKLVAWTTIAIFIGRFVRHVWALYFVSVAGVLEAALGFTQFYAHKSFGFAAFGESILNPLDRDVARAFIPGGRLLRAYGTFPHPNILAAFLALALIGLGFAYCKCAQSFIARIAFVIPAFIICLGLLVSFSRMGWIAGAVGVMTFFFFARRMGEKNVSGPTAPFGLPTVAGGLWRAKRGAGEFLWIIALCAAALFAAFHWAIVPRIAIDTHDYAVMGRVSEYRFAWREITEEPFFGDGLRMAMSEKTVHNLYLSILLEIGFAGLLGFALMAFAGIFKKPETVADAACSACLTALLLCGISDHFLWTLRPGAAMLWIALGLTSFKSNMHP